MGLLKVGTPKKWDDSKKDLRYIRNAGVHQFLSTYKRVKDFKGDDLLWGDEVEYGIFNIDNSHLRLALRGKEIMDQLNKQEVREYLQKGLKAVPPIMYPIMYPLTQCNPLVVTASLPASPVPAGQPPHQKRGLQLGPRIRVLDGRGYALQALHRLHR
jgi:hypothetical protein